MSVYTHDQETLSLPIKTVREDSVRRPWRSGGWQKGNAVKKARKKYHSPQEKVAILRRYLIDKIPVSHICDQFQLQHRIFYVWLKQLVDNGPAALERHPASGKRPNAQQPRIYIRPRESKDADQKWMISLIQGQFGSEEVRRAVGDAICQVDVNNLLTCIRNEPLKYRNRAVAILSYHRHIRVGHVAEFLGVSHSSVDDWVRKFTQQGCQSLLPFHRGYCKPDDKTYRDAVFEILHAPPSSRGFNRTTWRLQDIHSIMRKRGLPIAQSGIRKIAVNQSNHALLLPRKKHGRNGETAPQTRGQIR